MRSFKAFFMRRQLREKLLLTVLIAAGALIWASAFWTRGTIFTREATALRLQLKDQKEWIDREARIEEVTSEALATFKTGPSMTKSALQSRLDSIAQRVSMPRGSYTMRDLPAKNSPQFTLNSVQISFNAQNSNQDYERIQKFYTELQKERPNITVQTPFNVTATTGGRGGGSVSAMFNVAGVEMKK